MITPKEQRLLDRLHAIGRDLAKFNADLAEHFANDGGGAAIGKVRAMLDAMVADSPDDPDSADNFRPA